MTPVVRVQEGYTRGSDHITAHTPRFRGASQRRSAGRPPVPASRAPSGGSCPEESAPEGDLQALRTVRISCFSSSGRTPVEAEPGKAGSIENHRSVAVNKDTVFEMQAQPARQCFPLADAALATQVRCSIPVGNPNHFLINDGALI